MAVREPVTENVSICMVIAVAIPLDHLTALTAHLSVEILEIDNSPVNQCRSLEHEKLCAVVPVRGLGGHSIRSNSKISFHF
jgi:hypothetical protein